MMVQMPRWKVQLKNNSSGAFVLAIGTHFQLGLVWRGTGKVL